MRSLFLMVVVLITGCSPVDMDDTTYPYGLWKSSSGYSIEILRNNTYRVCRGAGICDVGELDFSTLDCLPCLANVSETKLGLQMLTDTGLGYRYPNSDKIDMYPNVSPGGYWRYCRGRPCRALGGADAGKYFFRHNDDAGTKTGGHIGAIKSYCETLEKPFDNEVCQRFAR